MATRKPMTEEQKKAAAERLKAAREKKAMEKAAAEAAQNDAEYAAVEETLAEKAAETPPTPIVQVVAPQEPMVKILYIDSVIPNNQIPIGKGRIITGSGRVFSVPLSDFEGEFQTPLVMALLESRNFIVLDGLTKELRQQYNVDYAEGEVIKNEGIFDWMLRCTVPEAVEYFRNLCFEHRELVGRRFMTAFEAHDKRLTRDRVEALNEISKADYADGNGIFTPIVKAINARV